MNIVIVGPSNSGKSFIARAIRKELESQGREATIEIRSMTKSSGEPVLSDVLGSMEVVANADIVVQVMKSRVAGEMGR